MRQSTNHILMIEPEEFYANPETMDTNAYQVEGGGDIPKDKILDCAIREFRSYRDMLVEAGVVVTTLKGRVGSPDSVFPNCISTYEGNLAIIHPMHSPNRRMERTGELLGIIGHNYSSVQDWSVVEKDGLALESTASIVSDHVNKFAYSGLSKRTSEELVKKWSDFMGYDVLIFETRSHAGIPVYHTDFLMYIGTRMAGVCTSCIVDDIAKKKVEERLKSTHDVIILTMEQLQKNCGNALEVVGRNGELMLTMSKSAFEALDKNQLKIVRSHYNKVIVPDIPTLEKYGGGSARCMLMEMF